MLIVWSRDIEVPLAYVIDGFVINEKRTIGMFDRAVGRENRVVRFDHRRRYLWCWIDGELKLGLLAIRDREMLEKKSTKSRSRTATEGVKDQKAL